MAEAIRAEGVVITGVYGSGKSSVAAEIADVLEKRGEAYALVDLDFLAWFDTGREWGEAERGLWSKNLADVVGNYLGVGVRRFVLAGFVRDGSGLEELRLATSLPVKVVRLTVPLDEIEARLRADVTTGRRDDLREAAVQLAELQGVGVEDLTVPNVGPMDRVAAGILEWLGW